MSYQVMPEMAPEEYAALKEDIAACGVMVPIEFDEQGNVLDGHHRLKICQELGIKNYPKVIRAGMNEDEKRTHAYKLNVARRHLTREQRREIIRQQIMETPELSDRQIAKMLGVSNSTVSIARWELIQSGQVCDSHTSLGTDGKEYQRKNDPLKKYALFTVEEVAAIRKYVQSIDNIKEAQRAHGILNELSQGTAEQVLELDIIIGEFIKGKSAATVPPVTTPIT